MKGTLNFSNNVELPLFQFLFQFCCPIDRELADCIAAEAHPIDVAIAVDGFPMTNSSNQFDMHEIEAETAMVRIKSDDWQRKRDEWLALSKSERDAIIQQQRQQHFDRITKECPMWSCECKQAYIFRSQSALIEAPFQCPTCDRVYDGRDWFRSTQLYNAITDWENLQTEARWLIGETGVDDEAIARSSSDEVSEWALELMDICAEITHQNARPIWSLAEVIWNHRRPLSADEIAEVRAAEAECRPLMELLWYKSRTKPWDPSEWEFTSETGGTLHLAPRPRLRPQQQEIIDLIREAGRRLTTDEVLTALEQKGKRRSEGTTKTTLAALVQFGPLTNTTDKYGRGYGLPEWSDDES